MERNERIHWIDIARGIFIIAIVVGHIFSSGKIRFWVFSFHVPAFFFISGYCYHRKSSFEQDLIKRVKSIAVPYLVFSIASILVFSIGALILPQLKAILECSFSKNILVMLYGNSKPDIMRYNLPLWFLPCFFSVCLIAYPIDRLKCKYGKMRITVLAVLLSMISSYFFSKYEEIALPWHFETALSMLGWFALGQLAKDVFPLLKEKTQSYSSVIKLYFCVLLIVMGAVFALCNTRILGVRNEHYGIVPVYWLAAFCGIMGFIGISIIIKQCKVLEYIGKRSMGILVLHKFPILVFQELIKPTKALLATPNEIKSIACGLLVLVITVIVCLIGEMIVRFIFPQALGYDTKR